jgi:hypothetical protein
MVEHAVDFYGSVISAGAILAGFLGSFLVFRIQREADYYRQPAVDYKSESGKDIYLGLSHFSSSFLLIVLATLCALVFGFLIPLFAIAGAQGTLIDPKIVVGGLVGSLVLMCGYFVNEMVHYEILNTRLLNDTEEWGRETPLVIIVIVLAVGFGLCSYWILA